MVSETYMVFLAYVATKAKYWIILSSWSYRNPLHPLKHKWEVDFPASRISYQIERQGHANTSGDLEPKLGGPRYLLWDLCFKSLIFLSTLVSFLQGSRNWSQGYYGLLWGRDQCPQFQLQFLNKMDFLLLFWWVELRFHSSNMAVKFGD